MEKQKEIRIHRNGTLRVKFDIKVDNGADEIKGKVYINDEEKGTLRETQETSYQTFTEDFTVIIGDLVQIYCATFNGGGGGTGDIKNFRLYYDRGVGNDYTINEV